MGDDARIGALNERHALPGVARIEQGNGGLPRVRIETKLGAADVYLYGGQVTSWQPVSFGEILFLSKESHWQVGKAIRGGIPVCFPWFRGKPGDKQAPTHGFVRTKEWRLDGIGREPDDSVTVMLSTGSDAENLRLWPYDFRLEYLIRVGEGLRLELKMHNTGASGLHFQEALHTYFKVGDVRRASIRGLDGTRYLDNRDGNREKVQEGELVPSQQTDNAYLDATGAVEILDPVLERRLVSEKQNSVSTIVWNPWSDGAAGLPDLGNEEWRDMLCVEGGNVLGQAVSLEPGGMHRMKVTISAFPT
jgi:glucose-6-phosphate 1-epimerase